MAAKNCWCVHARRGLLKKDDVTAKKTWINFDLSVGTKEQNVQKKRVLELQKERVILIHNRGLEVIMSK